MPTISNALNAFRGLFPCYYHFKVSSSKKLYDIQLTFRDKDFYHLAGFQYLTDIDIPKSATQLLKKIDSHKINDELLGSSMNYLEVNDSYANVRDRIYGIQYLKEYIESDNTVFQYIKGLNRYSKIKADFLIKSIVNHQAAYIFIKKRDKDTSYCICSFFINSRTDYFGIRSYWLYKSYVDTKTNIERVMLDKLKNELEKQKE